MNGGKGFADFVNPSAWVSGTQGARGTLLPEDDSKMPVLYRSRKLNFEKWIESMSSCHLMVVCSTCHLNLKFLKSYIGFTTEKRSLQTQC